MKPLLQYIEKFKFKDLFAAGLAFYMLYLLSEKASLRDVLIVLITFIIKHYFDSNTSSARKDETISTLASNQNSPVIGNSENTTINEKPV